MTKAAFYQGNRQFSFGHAEPVPPGAGEAQIRVAYGGICGTDLHIYHGNMDRRVSVPQVIGHEISGTVSALGDGVEGFQLGDAVAVMPLDTDRCLERDADYSHICEHLKFMGIDTPGGFQSYWTVPAYTLHRLPPALPLVYGALVEPLAVACHDVRMGQVRAGETIAILGGGPIGTLIGMVSQSIGAQVIVSEINPYRLEFARSLGMDAVNPRETDLVSYVMDKTAGRGVDVVFEVTGSAAGAEMMTKLPRIRGRIVIVGIATAPAPVDLFRCFWRELNLQGARVYEHQDFDRAIELASGGKLALDRIITQVRPVEQLQEAIEMLEKGGDVMKILIEVDPA
ncbi:MAG: alcohol dehydrogenase catalytic domain-containing protein [Anaerolineae bacterium]|nr:alcohol dehydrogenase catalytic domain-containing protein [Anaerolineae bacterium]